MTTASVVSVNLSTTHSFTKAPSPAITLLVGKGVANDAHAGATDQHLHHMKKDPNRPNLRQVHFMHQELFDELSKYGYDIQPGNIGENVTTRGLDILSLPRGTKLRLGPQAVVEITGLRSPCSQIEKFRKGLLGKVLAKDETGKLVRKAGVMGVVLAGGDVKPGDAIAVDLPEGPHLPLESV